MRFIGRMRLLLVDGHYYLYRSFFAIRGLRAPDGRPTNAIYGFAKALKKMFADVEPTHAAVVWDGGLPAKRTELRPDYKQNRPPMPVDMQRQEEWLKRNVSFFGARSLWLPKTEADDLIASLSRQAESRGMEVVIATNDKDMMQLVRPGVSIYSTAKSDCAERAFVLLGPSEVAARWGVAPERVGDFLALTGDQTDNISGVDGVGEKTAARLIREFGGLDDLLRSLERVKPKSLAEKISRARDLILENKEMVTLDEGIPLPAQIEELEFKPDREHLSEALKDIGFKSLLEEGAADPSFAPEKGVRGSGSQGELF